MAREDGIDGNENFPFLTLIPIVLGTGRKRIRTSSRARHTAGSRRPGTSSALYFPLVLPSLFPDLPLLI